MDPFEQNIAGVAGLINDDTNKVAVNDDVEEGIIGDLEDALELPMTDEELLDLKREWENKSNQYLPKVKSRQDKNKLYYQGKQRNLSGQEDKVIPKNGLFEAEETFIPQALSQNPEPVVFSDNTDEGKEASNSVKTMLQYHADVMCLRKKLGMMVRHWSIYFIGVVKHGWDEETNDIKTEIRKPQNFLLDPEGFVDEFGDFKGSFLGERIESSAERLMELFPKHKEYIFLKTNGKLGTQVVRTEWWTDKYCFTTFEDTVLDKHKNEYFNYPTEEKTETEFGSTAVTATPGINHFAIPKMPYTFLSVFSLQERPHDITNLIEQNIPNQDRITDRDEQITKNLASANNSVVLSGISFNQETAQQAVETFYQEGFLLVPDGNVEGAVKRIPADNIPDSVFKAQADDVQALKSVFGTEGLEAQQQNENTTARGMILNQQHASTRIGGGVGDALEQVADNIFNWWVQLYCVFYDEEHYAAIMGSGRAVEYVGIINTVFNRKFVISVAPNSMKPKDEISERNEAIELYQQKALDPISLFKKLDFPDPMETAERVVLWTTNPQMYMLKYFPQNVGPDSANAPDPNNLGGLPPPEDQSLSAPAASSSLSQVPINQGTAQPTL